MSRPVPNAVPCVARHKPAGRIGLIVACGLLAAVAIDPADAQTRSTDAFDDNEEDFVLRGLTGVASQPPAPAPRPPAAAALPASNGPISERVNEPAAPVDTRRAPVTEADMLPGIRAGRFVLRPTLSQRIEVESNSGASGRNERTYSRTEGAVSVLSDWSRHQLSIDASAAYEENLRGDAPTEPRAALDAALRLDLADETTATLRAGYDFYREDESDPNAVTGANVQAAVHEFSAGAGIARDIGAIRGSVDMDVLRTQYGSVRLSDGSRLDLDDRDETRVTLTSRVGYAISPALMPFLEAAVSRTEFDETADRNGFERSAYTYALRTGVAFDFGEKWSGELAAGYALRDIDDPRLASIDAFTLDGLINWSPLRGTDVELGVGTEIESSTSPERSGSVVYRLYGGLTHLVRSDITARLGGGLRLRDYQGGGLADQYIYSANAGLTWSISRYLDLEADAGYERTTQSGAADYDTARFGLGLTLRR